MKTEVHGARARYYCHTVTHLTTTSGLYHARERAKNIPAITKATKIASNTDAIVRRSWHLAATPQGNTTEHELCAAILALHACATPLWTRMFGPSTLTYALSFPNPDFGSHK